MQGGVAGALRVILVSDRCTEEGHDPIASVLIDRPLEAVNAVGEDLEEVLHDPVPFLGIELLREVHRPLHVGEENRDLLALTLESAPRRENLLGEVT
jgi:hypothetical protein